VFTIANWKYKHGLSNRLNNGGMVQGLGFGTESSRIGSISRTEDVHGLSQTILDSLPSETHEVFLQRLGWSYRSALPTRSGSRVEWRSERLHGLPRLFYLHAPGWTLVTLGTACVPPSCIPFLMVRNLG
jgi:hypothetical protein